MKDSVRTFPPTPSHTAVGNHSELDVDTALSKQSASASTLTSAGAATLGTKATRPHCLAAQGNVTAESSGREQTPGPRPNVPLPAAEDAELQGEKLVMDKPHQGTGGNRGVLLPPDCFGGLLSTVNLFGFKSV